MKLALIIGASLICAATNLCAESYRVEAITLPKVRAPIIQEIRNCRRAMACEGQRLRLPQRELNRHFPLHSAAPRCT